MDTENRTSRKRNAFATALLTTEYCAVSFTSRSPCASMDRPAV